MNADANSLLSDIERIPGAMSSGGDIRMTALMTLLTDPGNDDHWLATDWFELWETFDAGAIWTTRVRGVMQLVSYDIAFDPISASTIRRGRGRESSCRPMAPPSRRALRVARRRGDDQAAGRRVARPVGPFAHHCPRPRAPLLPHERQRRLAKRSAAGMTFGATRRRFARGACTSPFASLRLRAALPLLPCRIPAAGPARKHPRNCTEFYIKYPFVIKEIS